MHGELAGSGMAQIGEIYSISLEYPQKLAKIAIFKAF
jgi:hypothetical protein